MPRFRAILMPMHTAPSPTIGKAISTHAERHPVTSPRLAGRAGLLAACFTACLGTAAFAAQPCGELEPCETPRPVLKIKRIETTGVGHLAPGFYRPDQRPCEQFRLTQKQIRRYFARAGGISANALHYATSESACVVTGTAHLADGQVWQWAIGELREGSFKKPGTEPEYLYCSKCLDAPFVR